VVTVGEVVVGELVVGLVVAVVLGDWLLVEGVVVVVEGVVVVVDVGDGPGCGVAGIVVQSGSRLSASNCFSCDSA
jgi:hypothetical protein